MQKRFVSAILLSLFTVVLVSYPTQAYYCPIAALSRTPAPPNPVTVSGQIVSTSGSVQISDGSGTLTVMGLTGDATAYVTVKGHFSSGTLTVTTNPVSYTTPPSPGEQRQFLLPDGSTTTMCYVPAGSFLMGNSGVGDDATYSTTSELPQHSVYLSGYYIGENLVTRHEYQAFVNSGGYTNAAYWSTAGWAWKGSTMQPRYWTALQTWYGTTFTQTDNHPVVGVTYYEAEAFCNWAGGHLPTEAQWEKAARWTGSHANVYPWGDTWDAEKCNNYYDHNSAGGGYAKYQTSPVGSYPSGASPYGCMDMAGNINEWCLDWLISYPGCSSPFNYTGTYRVLRGGNWEIYFDDDRLDNFRCTWRYGWQPTVNVNYLGFRLAY